MVTGQIYILTSNYLYRNPTSLSRKGLRQFWDTGDSNGAWDFVWDWMPQECGSPPLYEGSLGVCFQAIWLARARTKAC